MAAQTNGNPDLQKWADRIPVFPAIRERGRHKSNIWIFDSPKNNRRLIIKGDVAFMHLVLLEGDITVENYIPEPTPVYASIDGEVRQTQLDAHVHLVDGAIEWWEFKRSGDAGPNRIGRSKSQLSAQAQAAGAAGVKYRVKTDDDLKGKEVLFDNWLMLCAAMTRCKYQAMDREEDILLKHLNLQKSVRFGTLLDNEEADPAYMLATVAKTLQKGMMEADLERSLFGLNTLLKWRLA